MPEEKKKVVIEIPNDDIKLVAHILKICKMTSTLLFTGNNF